MNFIKQKRVALNLTQQELADKAHLSKNSILNYESGKRSPKISDLIKIAQALDCCASELINEDGE